MEKALDEYVIKGVTHNIPLLRDVISHPRFIDGKKITTKFLAEEYPTGFKGHAMKPQDRVNLFATMVSFVVVRTEGTSFYIFKCLFENIAVFSFPIYI